MSEVRNQQTNNIDVNELLLIEPEKVDIKDPDEAVARILKGPAGVVAGTIAVSYTHLTLPTILRV